MCLSNRGNFRCARDGLRVPINHPARSGGTPVLLQHTTKSITSADVERCDSTGASVGIGKRSERSRLPESTVRPVLVVEALELTQRVEEMALIPDQGPVQ
jgi:hypothetical protein